MTRKANYASKSFFNPENSNNPRYVGPVVLIPKKEDVLPLVGCLHTDDNEKFLLTHFMSLVDLEKILFFDEILESYRGNSIVISNIKDYHIISSQEKIRQFLEANGAKYQGQIKTKKQKKISDYADTLIELSKNMLVLTKTTNGSVFYLGFTKNPMRDLKLGAHYLTLDDVLLILKKPSHLESASYKWNGYEFSNNGVTYNTLPRFHVPLQNGTTLYTEIDKIKKVMEKEAKHQQGLTQVVNALEELYEHNKLKK
jgi:hypothetical protein